MATTTVRESALGDSYGPPRFEGRQSDKTVLSGLRKDRQRQDPEEQLSWTVFVNYNNSIYFYFCFEIVRSTTYVIVMHTATCRRNIWAFLIQPYRHGCRFNVYIYLTTVVVFRDVFFGEKKKNTQVRP